MTIFNDMFLGSIFASQGTSLCFTERMGSLKYTELPYHSSRQHIVKVQLSFKAFYQHECYLKWRKKSLDIQEFEVYMCQKYEGNEEFINKKLDESYSYEKLSLTEVIYFLVSFLQFMFSR